MNKQEKTEKRDKLTNEFDARITFLQQQMGTLLRDREMEIKKIQDEIDLLTLQSEALKDFKIK